MTVKELETRMDSQELSEWMAMHKYFQLIPDVNRSLAILTTATIAGYAGRGNVPHPEKFMGMQKPPSHPIMDEMALRSLALEMGQWQQPSD